MVPFNFVLSSQTSKEIRDSLNLMAESFGPVDVSFREFYEWQYLRNPFGKGIVLLAYDGDAPIGQFAGIPCIYQFRGRIIRTLLTLNLAVSPKYRRKGIMLKLLEQIRKEDLLTPFSIGVPNCQSLKGHLTNGFIPLQMNLLVRPIRLSHYFTGFGRLVFRPLDIIWKKSPKEEVEDYQFPFDRRFDEWATKRDKNKIQQVRNAVYLNWRYASNPRRNYKIFVTREKTDKMDGYIIVRITEFATKSVGVIMDLMFTNETKARQLILKSLEYFWKNNVSIAISACFPDDIEMNLLRKFGFLSLPQRFHPHPMILGLKVLDNSDPIACELIDVNKWIFRFGDYDIF